MKYNNNLKIGYVPLNPDLVTAPGDYRRFVRYANIRGVSYEIAKLEKVYDVVIVTQGADITLWKDYQHGVIVYDLIDSYLSIPKTNIKGIFRGLAKYIAGQHNKLEFSYWKTIKRMCIKAGVVICSTKEQRSKILPYCPKTLIILDYHSDVIRSLKQNYKLGNTVKLIWEGLPSNLYQLEYLKNVLLRLDRKYNIELHIATKLIYSRFLGKYGVTSVEKQAGKIFKNVIMHEWKKETISDLVCKCDIAIIPIDGNYPLTKFKPENKILFFWKVGIPVVASNIVSYSRVMNNANLSFTCENEKDWFNKIESLILSETLRKSTAISGKKYANNVFCDKSISDKWDNVFKCIGIKVN
jgi:glycosyltransferase involved in cell wall biosynthesis